MLFVPARLSVPAKDPRLHVLGDAPLVAETPVHLLDDDTTPTPLLFIRNNGGLPEPPADPDAWTVEIRGEVERPLRLTVAELKRDFAPRTFRLVMECGGNGRSFFEPQPKGNAWCQGGVACAEWTGVALADVLAVAGPTAAARFTGHHGADPYLTPGRTGPGSTGPMSRGMRIEKALEPHTLLAFAVNGEPLPHVHGGPVRLVVPGWPGSLSTKWLTGIELRREPHDGAGMGGTSYRVPIEPLAPGTPADGAGFVELESMPTRSILTSPAHDARFPAGTRSVPIRGAAWANENEITAVHVSTDDGQSWSPVTLEAPRNRYDWRRFTGAARLRSDGWHRIWVRATDSRGFTQPIVASNWNPGGYGANPITSIAVQIGD